MRFQRCLSELDSFKAIGSVEAADEHQEGRAAAHEQSVGKHAQGLDETLLNRMGDIGRGCHIGCTTLSRLVAEQTTPDTDHNGHAQTTTCHLFKAEGIGDDQFQDMRHQVNVHDDNYQRKNQIAKRHKRHEDTAHTGNALNTAESDKQSDRRDNGTHHQGVEPESLVQRSADGIALDGVIGEAEGERDEHSKQSRHPLVVEAAADVISRATDI